VNRDQRREKEVMGKIPEESSQCFHLRNWVERWGDKKRGGREEKWKHVRNGDESRE